MIPALPEKDGQEPKPPVPAAPAASTTPAAALAVDHAAPEAKLADLYDQSVVDYVAELIDSGATETQIIDALTKHDFSREEGRRIVRQFALEFGVGPAKSGSSRRSTDNQRAQIREVLQLTIDAGKKDMAFGAMWCLGGLFLTVATFAARAGAGGVLFWGAVIWGAIQFFRGVSTVSSAKAELDRL